MLVWTEGRVVVCPRARRAPSDANCAVYSTLRAPCPALAGGPDDRSMRQCGNARLGATRGPLEAMVRHPLDRGSRDPALLATDVCAADMSLPAGMWRALLRMP